MRLVLTFDAAALLTLALVVPLVLGALVAGGYRYARRQTQEHVYAVLANIPLGVVVYDRAGRRAFTNSLADALLRQLDAAQIDQIVAAGLRGTQQTTVLAGQDGTAVQAQCRPLGAPGAGTTLTLRDVTQQQLAATNYLKFIHTISHELLTPLTAIHGHLAHIAACVQRNEGGWQGSLQVVQAEAERLTRLTSNLLILSRLETGQPLQRRPTNLAAVAEEAVLQLLDKADARRIALSVHAAPQLARPAVDRDAWMQVFLNLIDNAIKYGCEDGSVDVTLQGDGSTLLVTVSDDGPGIAPDDLPHVFTEMFRAEAQRHVSGSGLGLAIVRRIVEQHNGKIRCSSELGRGTTFQISLPVYTHGGLPSVTAS